jgi:hypothetical protein
MVEGMENEAKRPTSNVSWQDAADANNITFQRKLSVKRGKWRIMSPEAEASANAHEAAREKGEAS